LDISRSVEENILIREGGENSMRGASHFVHITDWYEDGKIKEDKM
jgi:hypothetical protein